VWPYARIYARFVYSVSLRHWLQSPFFQKLVLPSRLSPQRDDDSVVVALVAPGGEPRNEAKCCQLEQVHCNTTRLRDFQASCEETISNSGAVGGAGSLSLQGPTEKDLQRTHESLTTTELRAESAR